MTYEQIRAQLLTKVQDKIRLDGDRIHWHRAEIENFRQAQLERLLAHVQQHSVYYQQRCKNIKQLSDITPSTKKEVMDNWDNIVCVPNLTKAIAEKHLEQYRNNEISNPFYNDNYYITATGGSSGLRGLFAWDLDYFSIIGYAAFRYQYYDEYITPIKGDKKIAVLTAPTLIHASTPLFSITLDDTSKAYHYPADMDLNQMCAELNKLQPTHLIGYSSIITELAYRALAGTLKIAPQRVSTNSEPLNTDSRAVVRKAWNLEINNMWGSVEMGMAGIESDKHCGLFVSDDLIIIEPVNDNLQAVEKSTDATKLLITNLFNFTFPLIRYVVDDAVDIQETPLSGYRIAKDIEGRSDSWFIYHNNLKIHPITFRKILGQEPAITEYQVQQTPEGAIIRLILNKKLDIKILNQNLVAVLEESGLASPIITIETVTELPRHQETGKLRRFINCDAS